MTGEVIIKEKLPVRERVVYMPFPLEVTYHEQGWAFSKGAFSVEETKRIIEIGDALPVEVAKVGSGADGVIKEDRIYRDSTISWMDPTPDTVWIYDKVYALAKGLNKDFFGYDLNGATSFQYTVYNAEVEGRPQYYDWHVDRLGKGNGYNSPRKLSLVVNLTDFVDYEGGELWVWNNYKTILSKQRGDMVAFPSTTLHRVTPVTKGVRKSLVIWCTGPDFR